LYSLTKTNLEPVGNVLVVLAILLLFLSGLAVIGLPGLVDLSQALVVMGAFISAVLIIIFWHKWLVIGLIIDILLITGVFLT
jgi:hypothetical protein